MAARPELAEYLAHALDFRVDQQNVPDFLPHDLGLALDGACLAGLVEADNPPVGIEEDDQRADNVEEFVERPVIDFVQWWHGRIVTQPASPHQRRVAVRGKDKRFLDHFSFACDLL